jgi:hypothetical protein
LTIESGISFYKCFGVCRAVRKDLSRCLFWRQSKGPDTDETLEFGGEDHCEDLDAKDMSGGCV